VEHALVAAEAGAHYIGMICWPGSQRYAKPEEVAAVAYALQARFDYQARPLLVGVFVNETAENIASVVKDCALDWVQLSGDEPWPACATVPVPVIKALRVPADRPVDDLAAELARELPGHRARGGRVLIESLMAGQYGGTGHTANWNLAAATARQFPIMLSGGLTPENVAEAVRTVRPWAVDVASGVETDGVKDAGKIRSFIQAVHTADAELAASATPTAAHT
jgi:phosphoribosylanthranilate isomerase